MKTIEIEVSTYQFINLSKRITELEKNITHIKAALEQILEVLKINNQENQP